jgi:hypothetical protein
VCGARRGRYVVRTEVVDVYKRCELDARSVGMSVVMASMPTGVSFGGVSDVPRGRRGEGDAPLASLRAGVRRTGRYPPFARHLGSISGRSRDRAVTHPPGVSLRSCRGLRVP